MGDDWDSAAAPHSATLRSRDRLGSSQPKVRGSFDFDLKAAGSAWGSVGDSGIDSPLSIQSDLMMSESLVVTVPETLNL